MWLKLKKNYLKARIWIRWLFGALHLVDDIMSETDAKLRRVERIEQVMNARKYH